MERSEADEIKRIDTITQEISPTFCFAKWYHANYTVKPITIT